MALKEAPREFSKLLIKIGGILVLVLSVIEIIKNIALLLAIHFISSFVSGILGSLWTPLIALLGSIGSIAIIILLALNIAVGYVGYKLLKISEITPLASNIRDRWIIITIIFIALSFLIGESLLMIGFALALAGLILVSVIPPPPTS